jgi:vancomycin resistance protein YoaR
MSSSTRRGFSNALAALPRISSNKPWLARATLITVSIILLTNLVLMLLVAAYQVYYDGLIFPGVRVWGVDLGGKSPEDAARMLNGKFTYPQTATITFRDGSNVWPVTAGDLGVRFDIARTVQAAYDVGRHPNLFTSLQQQATAWRDGVVVSPVVVFDQIAADQYLRPIVNSINRPAVDATVQVNNLQAAASPSQIGREVDMAATMGVLGGLITRLESGEVNLVVVEHQPYVASADEAAGIVNAILASDIQVYVEGGTSGDPGPWIASREALAQMLKIEAIPTGDGATATYSVRLDEMQLTAFLQPLGPELQRDPVDARFGFNEQLGQLEITAPSQDGRILNIAATIQNINQLAISDRHNIPLVFDSIKPEFSDLVDGEKLGITELISSSTTYFPGSSAARKNNVQTAAARFDGVIIKPHEEFSFNYYLGDVSIDSGFDEALIIYNGRTIKGVGGGVCQVSTTAFQAAFYAGFPITMRVPHGYRVSYYEHGEGPGMDATVFSPVVDMKFVNDTDNYLLIKTFVDLKNQSLTFKFYSTSDGRTVQKDGPFITNQRPHGPDVYEENPEVAPGETKQVDYAVDGADVRIVRTVYRDGQILYQDTFVSPYQPWQAVYQVAPGHLPPGANTSSTNGY